MCDKVYKIYDPTTNLFFCTHKKRSWSDNHNDHAIYTQKKYCKQIISNYSKIYKNLDSWKNAQIIEYQLIKLS